MDDWRDRTVKPTRTSGLEEFPGAYFTLVTEHNIRQIVPFSCTSRCSLGVFALDLLKQRNWHFNITDKFGQISSAETLFPWQMDEIERVTSRTYRMNEVVFHDPVPLDPFLVRVIHVTPPADKSTTAFYPFVKNLGRQELDPDGVLPALNPALPLYCWPSFYAERLKSKSASFRRVWENALAETCGIDLAATKTQNAQLIKQDKQYNRLMFDQARMMDADRTRQNFAPLYMASATPDRLREHIGLEEDSHESSGGDESSGDKSSLSGGAILARLQARFQRKTKM